MRVIGVLPPHGTQLGMNIDEVAIVPVATGMRLFDRRSLFRIMIQVRGARRPRSGQRRKWSACSRSATARRT